MEEEFENYRDDPENGLQINIDNYKLLDIEQEKNEVEIISKNLINTLLEKYFETGLLTDDEYIKKLAMIESMSLNTLLIQLKYSEHAVDSFIRMINSADEINPESLHSFVGLQQEVIGITLQINNHIRNLPKYFQELKESGEQFQNILEIGDKEEIQEDDVTSPIRGTKELLQSIKNEKKMFLEMLDKIIDELFQELKPEEKIKNDFREWVDNQVNLSNHPETLKNQELKPILEKMINGESTDSRFNPDSYLQG